jgi:hypothetical protein
MCLRGVDIRLFSYVLSMADGVCMPVDDAAA